MPLYRVALLSFIAIITMVNPLLPADYLARMAADDPEAYRYLPASVHRFPSAPELAEIMREAGLVDVGYRRLMMGVVALHVGKVPG